MDWLATVNIKDDEKLGASGFNVGPPPVVVPPPGVD